MLHLENLQCQALSLSGQFYRSFVTKWLTSKGESMGSMAALDDHLNSLFIDLTGSQDATN
jgi:hypothetical protein